MIIPVLIGVFGYILMYNSYRKELICTNLNNSLFGLLLIALLVNSISLIYYIGYIVWLTPILYLFTVIIKKVYFNILIDLLGSKYKALIDILKISHTLFVLYGLALGVFNIYTLELSVSSELIRHIPWYELYSIISYLVDNIDYCHVIKPRRLFLIADRGHPMVAPAGATYTAKSYLQFLQTKFPQHRFSSDYNATVLRSDENRPPFQYESDILREIRAFHREVSFIKYYRENPFTRFPQEDVFN